MLYFTADLHLGHENIIRYCHRPFANVAEMDEELIDNWNSCIKKDDTVFYLGDFCFGNPDNYVPRLNGKIYFVPGSHDKAMKRQVAGINFLPELAKISPYGLMDEFGNRRLIVLCHHPMRSWHNSHYASWHLYGHHHGQLPPYGLSFDVGVDAWDYFPVSLDEVEAKMKTLTPIEDYRRHQAVQK